MGNFSAMFFVLLSYLVLLLSPTLKGNKNLLLAAWATLSVRHALAIINAFVTPLSGRWGDPYMFHALASEIAGGASFWACRQPYGQVLGLIYKIFGASFWLGEEASVLAYSFSLLLFVEMGCLVGASNKMVGCILLFGLMPSVAMHCSVTLRESYQVLGFLGSAYSLFLLRIDGRLWAWLLLLFSLSSLVVMHQSMALFVVAVLGMGVPWAVQGRGKIGPLVAVVLLSLGPVILPRLTQSFEQESSVVRSITDGKFLEYAATYREHLNSARSDYGVSIDVSTPFSFVSTTVMVISLYFLAPFPWQVSGIIDFYAFFEVLLRLALLYGLLRRLVETRGELRQRLVFLTLMTLGLEFMWAIGTTNWGTAIRHHVVVFGAFVLLGLPYYSSFSLDPEMARLLRRRERRKQLG